MGNDKIKSTKQTASKQIKSFLKRGGKLTRRPVKRFHTTDSVELSESSVVAFSSWPFLPSGYLGDSSKLNEIAEVQDDDSSHSGATDRVGNRKLGRKNSLQWQDLVSVDSDADEGGNHNSLTRKLSISMRNLLKPLKYRLRSDNRMRDKTDSRRNSKNSVSETSGYLDDFDFSYAIMPKVDLDRDLDAAAAADVHEEEDHFDALNKSEKQVGLLAVSRTPSFNTMLHANEFYSDSCTLLKRKRVRITWEVLAENTKRIIEKDKAGELLELSYGESVRDIGGRRISDMVHNRENFSGCSGIFGVQRMQPRGSLLVQQPSARRLGSNLGGVPLWSFTSTIETNEDFDSFVLFEKAKEWLKTFKTCDPRYMILKFFNDVANEGATGDSENFLRDHVSPLLKYFNRASVFTVWRPTSLQSIRRLMLGEGVGKGLDIKGKSAKRGKLSAFVPFLQIHKEEHKAKVRILQKDCKIRIFFNSKRDRDLVLLNLSELAKELKEIVRTAKEIIQDESNDEETVEDAMKKMNLDMDDPTINVIDTYSSSDKYGIEVQERLFWEGMVMRQNIYRKPASEDDIGRTSIPSFQDMNLNALRKQRNSVPGGCTRAVILQYNPPGEKNGDPMNPLNLLMAYEENDPENNRQRVIPVVSDFDCFIVGTRGVRYSEEVPEDQIEIVKWMVQQTEIILDKQSVESWTERWLDVLKESGLKGFNPKVPPGGFADPKTRFIFKHAINRLGNTGAVRHGAECFNYHFPQELDEELLVISDDLPEDKNCNWMYVNQDKLKEILKFKIDKGYTFPLNPKWVLCDEGWKEVYDKVLASKMPNVQQSLNCFYPPKSGLRELIENIYKKHPDGFERLPDNTMRRRRRLHSARLSHIDGTAAMDLAQQTLKSYLVLQRAKRRLRAFFVMNSLLNNIRERNDRTETNKDNSLDNKEKESQRFALRRIENFGRTQQICEKDGGKKNKEDSELEQKEETDILSAEGRIEKFEPIQQRYEMEGETENNQDINKDNEEEEEESSRCSMSRNEEIEQIREGYEIKSEAETKEENCLDCKEKKSRVSAILRIEDFIQSREGLEIDEETQNEEDNDIDDDNSAMNRIGDFLRSQKEFEMDREAGKGEDKEARVDSLITIEKFE